MIDNPHMSDAIKQNMSARLNKLMKDTPSMNTIKKVAVKSGVSYGTVRRIRVNEPIDPSIGNVESLAESFGLSLIEFVSAYDEQTELTEQERLLIKNIRSLSPEDAADKMKDIAKLAMLTKAVGRANLIQSLPDDQSKAV